MTKSLLSQAVNDSVENERFDGLGRRTFGKDSLRRVSPTKADTVPCNQILVDEYHQEQGAAMLGTYGASGINELEHLLASSVPECTPPSQNLLGSPPKRDMAANPLSHCSSWTRLACVSSQSNLDMLESIAAEEGAAGVGRSVAIPVPQISRCSSGAHWVPAGSVSPA